MGEYSVWDGSRPMIQRQVIDKRLVQAQGISMSLVTEDVRAPTDWCLREPDNTIVVHLAGRLSRMECVFSGGPATAALPSLGDVWVIPAGCSYAALAQGSQVRFAEFRLPSAAADAATVVPRAGYRDAFLHAASARAAALCARDDDLAQMMLQALLATMRLHIADAFMRSPGSGNSKAPVERGRFSARQQRRLVEHIAGSMHDSITVDELAAAAGVSMPHLLSGFKATFGTTPWQYVLRVRLAEARRLLENTASSVTTIAAATGFCSPSHFATTFGKHFGVSPARYRLEHRGGAAD